MVRKRVTVESPYKGAIRRNTIYLKRALRDSIDRGESPLASHLFYTQFLNDSDSSERQVGIECGLDWTSQADLMVFYLDYGMSSGMEQAMEFAQLNGIKIELRSIGRNGE